MLNLVLNIGYWIFYGLTCLIMARWVYRAAHVYDRAFRAGKPADWRLLRHAMRLACASRAILAPGGVGQAAVALTMVVCGVALGHLHSGVTGTALFQYGFVWVLGLSALIDQRTGLLVDALSYPLIALGLLLTWIGMTVPLRDALLAALVAGLVLVLARALASWLRGSEAVGMGDVKIFVAIGLWLGLQGVIAVLLLANVLFLVYVGWRTLAGGGVSGVRARYPFGPFIWASVVLFYVLTAVTMS